MPPPKLFDQGFLAADVVAVDFGGVLAANPVIQYLAVALLALGKQVHLISAVPAEGLESTREMVSELQKRLGVTLSGIHFVIHPHGPNAGMIAGQEKARVMRQIGAAWLIDDNKDVCQEVRAAGFEILQISGSLNFYELERH